MIAPKKPISWKDVARHYNELDPIYQKTWGEHLHHGLWSAETNSTQEAVENLSNRVIARLKIRQGASVCDIGCGYAATARLIAERFSSQVTGLTISKAQYEKAKHKKPKFGKLNLLLMNWLENNLDDESFDHAFAIESSEHMENQPKFFSEAYRVLKPNGTFVICAWLSRSSVGPLERSLLLEPVCRHGRLAGLGTKEEYERMLIQAGFRPTHFEDLSSQVHRTWSIAARRFAQSLPWDRSKLQLLFRRDNPQLGFFITLFRIRLAYQIGAMRYGIFTAIKPHFGSG
jgi:tocopherol O-methyltransferase